jgi:hypothetical protein
MSLLKAIFPFSPGKVPNADCWFGSSDGSNIMKTLDAKIMNTPIIARPYTMVVLFASGSAKNNGILILCQTQGVSKISRMSRKVRQNLLRIPDRRETYYIHPKAVSSSSM